MWTPCIVGRPLCSVNLAAAPPSGATVSMNAYVHSPVVVTQNGNQYVTAQTAHDMIYAM